MKFLRVILSVAALSFAAAADATAADADSIIPAVQEDAYVPVEVGNGWYLRGDLGINLSGLQKTDYLDDGPTTKVTSIRDRLAIGGGFGYQVNDIFRVDATFDRIFKSVTESTAAAPAPVGPCKDGMRFQEGPDVWVVADIANCIETDRAQYKTWLMMANAYADLGTFAKVTPFVGGGVGFARVKWWQEVDSITCVPVSAAANAEVCNGAGTIYQPAPNEIFNKPGIMSAGTDWRLAVSLTGGLSYDVSRNLKLESAYRFTHVGKGKGGMPTATTTGADIAKDGFNIHQVKMALRYSLW